MSIKYPGGSKDFDESTGKYRSGRIPKKPVAPKNKPPFQPKVKPGGPILLPGNPKSAFPKLVNTKIGLTPNQRMVGGITKTGGKLVNPTYNTY